MIFYKHDQLLVKPLFISYDFNIAGVFAFYAFLRFPAICLGIDVLL